MKLCIPIESIDGYNSKLYGHFGSAPYFAVYDTNANLLEFVENINLQHEHGACHPLGLLGEKSIDAVMCNGMGLRAFLRLNEYGIKVYKLSAETVQNALEQYKMNTLKELSQKDVCSDHKCH